jgi:hypothetical protein
VEVSGLRVGSIHAEPLTTLVARIRDRFLLQVLRRRGFGYLYGLLATLDPELHARLPDPASHVSACSLCAAIFSAPELAERITAALDRHQLELAHDLLAGD